MADNVENQSIASLFNNLLRDLSSLIRQEVELARTETSEKVGQAGRNVASLAIGGAIAYAGFLYILLAATYALSQVVEAWVAALIVGAVVSFIGVVMLKVAQNRLRASQLKPERTLESLREDAAMVRQQARGR